MDRETRNAKAREYYARNRERINEYQRAYYRRYYSFPENAEKRRAYNRAWAKEHAKERREYWRKRNGVKYHYV